MTPQLPVTHDSEVVMKKKKNKVGIDSCPLISYGGIPLWWYYQQQKKKPQQAEEIWSKRSDDHRMTHMTHASFLASIFCYG